MSLMTPEAFARDYIFTWEDGRSTNPTKTHSMDAADNGNWTGGKRGSGQLVGSNHGVTPAALAKYRGIKPHQVTFELMRGVTIDEAADLALKDYYKANKLDLLPWNAVTASVMDFGYTAGAFRAVEKLQELIRVNPDGKIGPNTIKAYKAWLDSRPISQAAEEWAKMRSNYYEAVIRRNPGHAKYRKGWQNRTNYFRKNDSNGWWQRFISA